jgi:hypothetical protein
MDVAETGFEDIDWISLTQDKDQWRSLVKTVKNILLLSHFSVCLFQASDFFYLWIL